jgi:hypothetical protein
LGQKKKSTKQLWYSQDNEVVSYWLSLTIRHLCCRANASIQFCYGKLWTQKSQC